MTTSNEQIIDLVDRFALEQKKDLESILAWLDQVVQNTKSPQSLTLVEYSAAVYFLSQSLINQSMGTGRRQRLSIALRLHRAINSGIPYHEPLEKFPWDKVSKLPASERLFCASVALQVSASAKLWYHQLIFLLVCLAPDIAELMLLGLLLWPMVFLLFSGYRIYVLSAIFGFIFAGVAENIFHRYGNHPSLRLLEKLRPYWFGRYFYELFFNHTVIHHGRTFKNYTEQFTSPQHQIKTDDYIREKMGPDFLNDMQANEYGVTITPINYLRIALPVVFLLLAVCVLLHLQGWAAFFFIFAGFLYPSGVILFHRYMHMKTSEIQSVIKGRFFLRHLLFSRYTAMMAIIHRLHHVRPSCNFNLTFWPIEFFLGTMHLPSVAELSKIRQLKILGSTWGMPIEHHNHEGIARATEC